MSRSKRKTPIFGNTTATSDKEFKSHSNRAKRRAQRQGKDTDEKVYGDPWNSAKDGKNYFHKATDKDMRK